MRRRSISHGHGGSWTRGRGDCSDGLMVIQCLLAGSKYTNIAHLIGALYNSSEARRRIGRVAHVGGQALYQNVQINLAGTHPHVCLNGCSSRFTGALATLWRVCRSLACVTAPTDGREQVPASLSKS